MKLPSHAHHTYGTLVDMQLDPISLRVLGSLIEKEITTPESYPLSLNALVNACNQRSSREPVLELTEEEVRQALHTLEDRALTTPVRDSRVPKYEHRIRTVLNLRRDETAVLCLLLLRGPQTPGELRSRADRLYTFDDLAAVQSTLERLGARPAADQPSSEDTGPLVTILPRQPGSREARYAHLLGAPPDLTAIPAGRTERAETTASATQRIAQLEADLAILSATLQTLQSRVDLVEARLQERLQSPHEEPVSHDDSSVR
ncbi:YceH family protein [Granulicella sp. S190]|uniref:YceH family protein n=1 Tax=Granulicella sp. S190 TaxID=1747226 RepID=UPI0020B16208|nr:YceH family protein [Granulicella sp. S190]